MKDAYIDVETGGFDYKKNPMLGFGMVIKIDGNIKEEIDILIKPFDKYIIEEASLEVTGLTREKIDKEGLDPNDAFKKIIQTLDIYIDSFNVKDKFNFYGWNGRFDGNFLRQFFTDNNCKFFGSYFWTPPLDLMAITMYALKEERTEISSAKLSFVAKYLDIDVGKYKLHSALDDVKLMMEVESAFKKRQLQVK